MELLKELLKDLAGFIISFIGLIAFFLIFGGIPQLIENILK